MRVTVLGSGTSGGVPMIACDCNTCMSDDAKDKRLRSSVMVEDENRRIVIDCGPDFRQQMLREKVDRLDAVVFTHEHKDHTGGLDEVRAFNFISKQAVNIYASSRVVRNLKEQYSYVFSGSSYPGIPKVNINYIHETDFEVAGFKVKPIKALHYKLPVLGFRIGDFSYLTDANHIEPEELDKMKGTKILIINALRKEKHISHFSLDEALQLIKEINPQRSYLTHISHQMGKHAEIEPQLPERTYMAYDTLKISI